MIELIDSHTHLDLVMQKGLTLAEITSAMQQQNVTTVVQIGADPESMIFAREFAHLDHPFQCYYTVGCHPSEVELMDCKLGLDFARENRLDPKFKAIGEIGLEYFYKPETAQLQKKVFYEYCLLARELNLPVCIHTRDAHQDTLTIVKEFYQDVTFLLHCFTGNRSQMEDYLQLGCFISFSGIVTFKNAHDLQEAARSCPLDKIMVETDAPFLTPVPFRGKTNHPAMVRETLKFIARHRNIEEESLAQQTTLNTKKFYRL